jgi:hypothetical protein
MSGVKSHKAKSAKAAASTAASTAAPAAASAPAREVSSPDAIPPNSDKNSSSPDAAPSSLLDLLPRTFPKVETANLDDESRLQASAVVWRALILSLIALLAFLIRVFSVVKGESQIHEFDPHFNWRATKVLASEGFTDFLNWFDDRAWYPLGRNVGQTVYPGLLYTASLAYWALNWLSVPLNVRNACVFLGGLWLGPCVGLTPAKAPCSGASLPWPRTCSPRK